MFDYFQIIFEFNVYPGLCLILPLTDYLTLDNPQIGDPFPHI